MELPSLNIKRHIFLYLGKWNFPAQKSQKNYPKKNSLYFWKLCILSLILISFLYLSGKSFSYIFSYIFSKESIYYISRNRSLHFLAEA